MPGWLLSFLLVLLMSLILGAIGQYWIKQEKNGLELHTACVDSGRHWEMVALVADLNVLNHILKLENEELKAKIEQLTKERDPLLQRLDQIDNGED
jgi:hypothetical protein